MIAENDIILQKMTLYYKKACTFFILTIKLIDNKELSITVQLAKYILGATIS